MTRQLIIGSALIAAVAAPALAGTRPTWWQARLGLPIPPRWRCPRPTLPVCTRHRTRPSCSKFTFPSTTLCGRATPRKCSRLCLTISIKASDAAGLFRASNPAVLFKKHDSTDWLRYVNPVVNRVRPLFVDDSLRRRICTACIPFVLRDPNLVSHHISGQNRVDLGGHTLLLRRIPAPGHAIGVELHIGDTTSVNGKIDNQ